jgi:hypothetical protein
MRVQGFILRRDFGDGIDVVAGQAHAGRADQEASQRKQGNGTEGPSHVFHDDSM